MTRTAIPGVPNIKVEFAPTGDASTTSPTWVDITAYLRLSDGVTFNRGRTDERSTSQPGNVSLSLNNDDGRFTPGLPAGAYAPLRIRCPIRVSFKPPGAGSYTVLWTGLVDQFDPGWENGKRAICRVSGSDRLARLQRRTMSRWETECHLASGATHLWPLVEDNTATTIAEIASGTTDHSLSVTLNGGSGSLDFGAGELPVDDGTVLALTPTSLSAGYNMTGAAMVPGSYVGHSMSVLMLSTVSANAGLFRFSDIFGSYIGVQTTSGGKAQAVSYSAFDGVGYTVTSTAGVCDGLFHQVGLAVDSAGTVTLYVDGVSAGTVAGYPPISGSTVTIGGTVGALYSGQISHCALWANMAPTTAMQTGAYAAVTGGAGETTTARFTRIAAMAGTTATTVGTGLSTMGKQPIAGRSTLDALNDCGEAELSPVYLTPGGAPALASRSTRYNAAVGLALVASDIGADVSFTVNDEALINDTTAIRPDAGASELRVTNPASISRYGTHDESLTINVADDTQLAAITQWRANVRAEPAPRTEQLVVAAWVKQATVSLANTTALEVGSRVQVASLPATAPATVLDLFAEGFSDTFSTTGWVRMVNTSSVGASGSVWQLDSATYSQLDSTTILAV